jgi:hypothetical protein
MIDFNGYESKFEYAIRILVAKLNKCLTRSEADEAISSYTRQLPNGVDSLNKGEIDKMCDDISSKLDDF